ncbi:MAG: RsmE family RNA methyltransferase [Planctomycetes bacterium]|nr:RsmE family RNA methyltransferase [Planctomycetota bacterium]
MRIVPLDSFPDRGRAVVTGEDAQHFLRALRVRVGELWIAQDREGRRRSARVAATRKHEVELELLEELAPFPRKAAPLWLATAAPKGKLLGQLIRGCTEAGCDRFLPTRFARSVRDLEERAEERLRRCMHEAVKQCGLPETQSIAPPLDAADLPAAPEVERVLFVPGAAAPPWIELARALPRTRPWLLVIGPEGGFETQEIEALGAAPSHRASLGPQVLRLETAAIVATAIAGQVLWSPG